MDTLGSKDGYQHLWHVATGAAKETALVSWLQNNSYYTWLGTSSNAASGSCGDVTFTRSGANDPSFNLRSEPGFMLRSQGDTTLFASVVETHGFFNEEFEQSVNARGQVSNIRVIGHNDSGSVVEITTGASVVTLMVSNQADCTDTTAHHLEFNGQSYSWSGTFSLDVNATEQEK